MLSMFLAFTTYGFTRSNVVQQRDRDSVDAAQRPRRDGAGVAGRQPAQHTSARSRPSRGSASSAASSGTSDAWSGGSPPYDFTSHPAGAPRPRDRTTAMPSRMTVHVGNEPNIVVGWPLPRRRRLLRVLQPRRGQQHARERSAVAAVRRPIITTGLGVLLGVFAARRAVRPVRVAAQAAKAIAGGRLDTRLEPTDDPDLSVLANSFNDMASALQLRVERDARFASDVSHELRSPLMTLAASVEVMEARRDEMPERAQAALDLLSERRDPLPGSRRGPARDQPLRRRRDPTPPRGAARGRVRPPRGRRQQPARHAGHGAPNAPSRC